MIQFNDLNTKTSLFDADVEEKKEMLDESIKSAKILVVGAAGTIGQSVTKELFARDPGVLHAVDISENNLVELVRDIRSTFGYIEGDFKTFAVPIESDEFTMLCKNEGPYDYIFNLSALKHVRSERDPYTLKRMVDVNVVNSIKLIRLAEDMSVKKYFTVSTDKAANPANLMGATKRVMEYLNHTAGVPCSSARFANVAFSDGSLLHGFKNRILKGQPISAPADIKRYFLDEKEAGQLCLMSSILGEHSEIFFPKLEEGSHLISFTDIAKSFLAAKGYTVLECDSEEQARSVARSGIVNDQWPCYFFKSDTSGEKPTEEFYTEREKPNFSKFRKIGVVQHTLPINHNSEYSRSVIEESFNSIEIDYEIIKKTLVKFVPELDHIHKNRNLDERM